MKVTKVKYSECCQILNIQAIRVIFFLNCKIFKVLFKSNTKSALIDVEHGFPMSRSPQGHLKVKGQICQKSLTGYILICNHQKIHFLSGFHYRGLCP